MSSLDTIAACAGSWTGTNTLHDPTTGKPETTDSTLTVTPVLGGRFVRIDYTWSYQGAPQEGSFLLGTDPKAATTSSHWIDSWHMGRAVLVSTAPPTATTTSPYSARSPCRTGRTGGGGS